MVSQSSVRTSSLALVPVLLILAGSARAQISGGAFRGEVRDDSSAVVPQARIAIQSAGNGTEVTAESNGEGIYVTPTLVPGAYLLIVTRMGFKTEIFGPVSLSVNQTIRVDFSLHVGQPAESVDVKSGPAQLLSAESSEIAQVIASTEVSEIPLNGRNWQDLIRLSAGVNPGAPAQTGSPNAVNVNGQRDKANLYMVDGISTTSSTQGRANSFNIPLEAVREFSVQSGAYSAEFGNVGGGVINLESKSGTNVWHASAFEFFRNDKMDAANFFSNATGQHKNALRYNQPGGSVGGPLQKNKTFLFADYQATLLSNAAPMLTSVPLSAQRTGDFSATAAPIYDPAGTSLARTRFPGNVIPATRIDPAASAITALLPPPNLFDGKGNPLPFTNYAVTGITTSAVHSFDIRLDRQLSDRSSVFARHSFQNTAAVTPSIFGLPLGGSPGFAGTTRSRNQNAGIGHVYQFSPTLINEIRIGLNRQTTALTQQDYGQNLSQQFGIPGVNHSPDTSGLSTLNVAGLFTLGGSILTPLRLATTSWNLSEKLMWVKGRHTLRFGFDSQHELGSTGYLVFGRGYYTFLNLTTSTLVGAAGGNAFASFLVGAPFQILRDSFPPGEIGLISNRYGFFVQDDFKVTRKFTLNLGARYDIMPYGHEIHDRLSNFDPVSRTMLLAGVNTIPNLRRTDYKDLAPRVGLAWAPGAGQNFVIRAGYGIGFVDPVGSAGVLNSQEFNIPFYFRNNITEFPFTPPTYTLSQQLPGLVVPSPSAPSGDQRYLVPNDRNQYSQTWTLSLQRALGTTTMLEVAYVGTSGVRLLNTSNINAAGPGPTDPTTRQPFGPALGQVEAYSNGAHSTYNGLQTKLEKRLSHGLYFLESYTWSRSMDNQSNGTDDSAAGGQFPQNFQNFSLERASSSFDRTSRFAGSFVWQLPGWRAAWKPLAGATRGWQWSGIFEAETGTPFSVLMPCATINAQGNNCRPNRLSSGELASDQRSVALWFNPAAFVTPSPAAYGNAGRNILRAPGLVNTDMALSRSFHWSSNDSRRLQIRWEVFNALNHTNLGVPIHSTDSPALGSITSAGAARVIQLGARLEF
jgi:hypothetical protein